MMKITKHQTLTWGREEAECGVAGHTYCNTLAVLLTHTTHADVSSKSNKAMSTHNDMYSSDMRERRVHLPSSFAEQLF